MSDITQSPGVVHIPASPGPYAVADSAPGPAAVIQVSHGHFLLTLSVQTTFKPSAVLPSLYGLLPHAQLQIDHIDLQVDEQANKLRVQLVGVNPANNKYAVDTLAQRLKTVQPGATVVVRKDLSQLSVDSDSVAAISTLLMSSQSRAVLDQYVHYYRLHSHPSFVPSLFIYLDTRKLEHVLNLMRNFMADPTAGGIVRPPRPSGLELKSDDGATQATAAGGAAAAPVAVPVASAPATPEKPMGPPLHRGVSSSSRSPHFKGTTSSKGTLGLPPAAPLDSALSAGALAATFNTSTSSTGAPTGPAANMSHVQSMLPPGGIAHAHSAAGQAVDPHHQPLAPRPTSVAETSPIRVDNKWWASKRAELLRLQSQHSFNHDALYVYSLPALQASVASLQTLKSVDRLFFSVKANHHPEVLRTLYDANFGFECVSVGELKLIKSLFADIGRDRLLFTPNFAAKVEYEEGYYYTDNVTLDNVYPLSVWPEVFRGKRVLMRIDPGQQVGYHDDKAAATTTATATATAASPAPTGKKAPAASNTPKSKFGMTGEQLLGAIPTLQQYNIKVVGLHVHAGSGIQVADTWARLGAFLAQFVRAFPELEVLDLGGGLGVQYKDTEAPLDLAAVEQGIAQLRRDVLQPTAAAAAAVNGTDSGTVKKLSVWLEPGRFVVATSGVLLCKVTQLKHKSGRAFVGVSTGMNSLLRPALYEAHHDIINLSRLPAYTQAAGEGGRIYLNSLDPRTCSLVDVVGPICDSGDVLGFARALPADTAEDDVILIDTVGAYGHVLSNNYNLRAPAHQITLHE